MFELVFALLPIERFLQNLIFLRVKSNFFCSKLICTHSSTIFSVLLPTVSSSLNRCFYLLVVCADTHVCLAFILVSWTDHNTVVSFYHQAWCLVL